MEIKELIKNKKGESGILTRLLMALLFFSVIIVGVSSITGSFLTYYGLNQTTTNLSYLSLTTDIGTDVQNMSGTMNTNTSSTVSGSGLFTQSWRITRAFEVIPLLFSTGDLVTTMVSDVSSVSGAPTVPSWFTSWVSVAIALFVLLTIVAIFIGRQV